MILFNRYKRECSILISALIGVSSLQFILGCSVSPSTLGSSSSSSFDHCTVEENLHVYMRGAVAADHIIASQAGSQMLELGGNAVDAAVAASFTLAVVRPESCGIGGGGFMVIYLPSDPTHGEVITAINYRETAYVDPDYYERTGKSSTQGGAAVAIPGTVAGLLHALEHYGTLSRKQVLAPAIDAAMHGVIPDHQYIRTAMKKINQFEKNPELKDRFSLMWKHFLQEGQLDSNWAEPIINQPMANVLQRIVDHGREGFTHGEVGKAIIRAVNDAGGEMTQNHLASYKVIEYQPLEREINGYRFVTMPPPSSGGITMLETLLIMDAMDYDFAAHSLNHPDQIHVFIESLKHAFADRSAYLADPEFVDLPIETLLSQSTIEERSQLITTETHHPSYYGTPNLLPNDHGTSHISVVDQWGGAVACTETVNLEFGSMVGVDEFGFVLNNEMDDFTTVRGKPNAFGLMQSERNLPEPNKRPLSSMSPTIVLDDQGVFAVSGASGGPRIITGTLQSLLNAMAGKNAYESMHLPRVHHQWLPDILKAEQGLYRRLLARSEKTSWNQVGPIGSVGNVQIILRDPNGRGWQAASDRRKGGIPSGMNEAVE